MTPDDASRPTPPSTAEDDATALARVAVVLSSARESGDPVALDSALDLNLYLWVGIRTLVRRPDNALPPEVKDNLLHLSAYVARKCVHERATLDDADIGTLINANLQIAEGLLEGQLGAASAPV
ncbi:flagellar biosynthesis regulator FlaF [Roseospira navarrensis]|uniref:Flagellar protein FlaF n=1 Tax=Roseospira navarrensis TaxID=140058 RepID=A0A7X1ZGJ5_9PROT|nr:flagellar biosynthesis regulator FlaF [Roseospira navarrensis]MQX38158.1 hypothetical protein [Roseospira navarrensis]